jgi:hypothetical protein
MKLPVIVQAPGSSSGGCGTRGGKVGRGSQGRGRGRGRGRGGARGGGRGRGSGEKRKAAQSVSKVYEADFIRVGRTGT